VRQRVGLTQPSGDRQNRHPAGIECCGNLVRIRNEDAIGKLRRNEVRVLIHREYGHPVRGVIANSNVTLYVAHCVRKRPTSWHDEQPALFPRGRYLRKGRTEIPSVRENATPKLYDDLDAGGLAHLCGS
jgi:hypothetical protein